MFARSLNAAPLDRNATDQGRRRLAFAGLSTVVDTHAPRAVAARGDRASVGAHADVQAAIVGRSAACEQARADRMPRGLWVTRLARRARCAGRVAPRWARRGDDRRGGRAVGARVGAGDGRRAHRRARAEHEHRRGEHVAGPSTRVRHDPGSASRSIEHRFGYQHRGSSARWLLDKIAPASALCVQPRAIGPARGRQREVARRFQRALGRGDPQERPAEDGLRALLRIVCERAPRAAQRVDGTSVFSERRGATAPARTTLVARSLIHVTRSACACWNHRIEPRSCEVERRAFPICVGLRRCGSRTRA